jgi:hypothetical protein
MNMDMINYDLLKEYDNDRNNFITNFEFCMIKMLRNNDITKFSLKKHVSKVSFVPLYIKDDQAFVSLGKHTFGKRKDQYNFIGGGTSCIEEDWDFKNDFEKLNIIASALFDEVFEELGIMLNWDYFKQCLLDVKRSGSFLLFYVHICDIDPEVWKNMQNDRLNIEKLRMRYTEISDIKNYDLKFIQNEYERVKNPKTNKIDFYVKDEIIEVSRYVLSMNRHMSEMIEKVKNNSNCFAIDVKKFKSIPLKYIHVRR